MVLVCVRDKVSIHILNRFGLPYIANEACHLPFLLKKIVAKHDDTITVINKGIIINNYLYPNTLAMSRYKSISLNPLSVGTKYKLGKNEYFLLGRGSNSYDSRYFGLVRAADLQYKAILFWRQNNSIFHK